MDVYLIAPRFNTENFCLKLKMIYGTVVTYMSNDVHHSSPSDSFRVNEESAPRPVKFKSAFCQRALCTLGGFLFQLRPLAEGYLLPTSNRRASGGHPR